MLLTIYAKKPALIYAGFFILNLDVTILTCLENSNGPAIRQTIQNAIMVSVNQGVIITGAMAISLG